jgi:mono/diheme cytochrome c family protein
MRSLATTLVALLILSRAVAAQNGYPVRLNFGTTPAPGELSQFFATAPDGSGLPPGKGSVAEGLKVYAQRCASCHGDKMQGVAGRDGDGGALVGGRGSLRSDRPIKTVESYWPYATTIFDYVKRAMPQDAPGSLTNDQVYSVVAVILYTGKIVGEAIVLDATTLPRIVMPNHEGFMTDKNLATANYR